MLVIIGMQATECLTNGFYKFYRIMNAKNFILILFLALTADIFRASNHTFFENTEFKCEIEEIKIKIVTRISKI